MTRKEVAATMWQTWKDMGDIAFSDSSVEEKDELMRAMSLIMEAHDILVSQARKR